MALELANLHGVYWKENGQTSLAGVPLAVFRKLDRLFVSWADECEAAEYRFPVFIEARELHKLDYFSSFPHLATFPITLDSSPEHLKEFSREAVVDDAGTVR